MWGAINHPKLSKHLPPYASELSLAPSPLVVFVLLGDIVSNCWRAYAWLNSRFCPIRRKQKHVLTFDEATQAQAEADGLRRRRRRYVDSPLLERLQIESLDRMSH